jgi:hypothetical protein
MKLFARPQAGGFSDCDMLAAARSQPAGHFFQQKPRADPDHRHKQQHHRELLKQLAVKRVGLELGSILALKVLRVQEVGRFFFFKGLRIGAGGA